MYHQKYDFNIIDKDIKQTNKPKLSNFVSQGRHEELQTREEGLQTLMAKGTELTETCPPEDVAQISEKLRRLKDLLNDTSDRADKHKVRA